VTRAERGASERTPRAAGYINSGLTDGTLRSVVGEVFDGLDSIRGAHRMLDSNRHTGEIVVRI
jgi:NADPH:quinone reductase-like Zn-dependent oxidoreductase